MAHKAHDPTPTPTKRVYEAPQLKELGSVEELTQGPTTGGIDSIGLGQGGFGGPS